MRSLQSVILTRPRKPFKAVPGADVRGLRISANLGSQGGLTSRQRCAIIMPALCWHMAQEPGGRKLMDYNPFAPEVKQDPYPYYAALRREAPVYRIEPL